MTATQDRQAYFMKTDELAELLGVTPRTIQRWRRARAEANTPGLTAADIEELGELGPPFVYFSRSILYRSAVVHQWIMSRERGAPSPSRGTPSAGKGTPAGKGGTRGR